MMTAQYRHCEEPVGRRSNRKALGLLRSFQSLAMTCLVLVCPILIGCSHHHPVDAVALFNKANAAYKNGDYKSAVESYQKIVDAGLASVEVYYNLGNCFMKENQLGHAIVWYERALRLQPRDSDVRANWAYAKGMIKNPEPAEPKTFERRLFVHLSSVTTDEIVVILAVVLAGISALVLIGLFLGWRFQKTAILIGLFSLVFVFHLFAFFAKIDTLQDRAIILSSAEVKYEPEEKSTTHFTAYEGWKVRVLKESSGWVKIKRPDGLQGWVPRDKLEWI